MHFSLTLALASFIQVVYGETVNLEFSRVKCGPDKASVNVPSSFHASQEYRCASACVREPLCSLYNYNADRQLCELTKNVTKVNCEHFQNKSGFISSAVVSWFILFVKHYDASYLIKVSNRSQLLVCLCSVKQKYLYFPEDATLTEYLSTYIPIKSIKQSTNQPAK